MPVTDILTNRSKSQSLEFVHDDEMHSREPPVHDYQQNNTKLKKPFHTPFFDKLHRPRRSSDVPTSIIAYQQQNFPRRPSIIKPSDLPRTMSKKSVKFVSLASIDEQNNSPLETTIEKDIVILIPNKEIDNEITTDLDQTIEEPYPFRSETSSIPTSLPKLSIESSTSTTSHHSRNSLIHHLLHHRHPKKLSYPIQTVEPVTTIHRSSSAPDILFSSTPIKTILKRNDQEQPTKTIGTWLKSTSLSRFFKSFGKNSRQNQKISTAKSNKKNAPRSARSSRCVDLVF